MLVSIRREHIAPDRRPVATRGLLVFTLGEGISPVSERIMLGRECCQRGWRPEVVVDGVLAGDQLDFGGIDRTALGGVATHDDADPVDAGMESVDSIRIKLRMLSWLTSTSAESRATTRRAIRTSTTATKAVRVWRGATVAPPCFRGPTS